MCAGAKKKAAIISNTDLLIMPLNRNNIRDHDNDYENQTENIDPLHRSITSRNS